MTSPPYTLISRLNHWLVAVGMIAMLGFGFYLGYADLARAEKGPLIGLHKAIGVVFLVFALWRVGWRLFEGFPEKDPALPPWQQNAAISAHWLLLVGVVLLPVSGIISSLFRGRDIELFGLFTWPAFATEVPWIANLAGGIHQYAGWLIAALVVAHMAAALKHHWLDRDGTLIRMLSGPVQRSHL